MATITDLTTLIDTNLASASDITATEHRAVSQAIVDSFALLYEVKELDVPVASFASFLASNFDGTGLGISAFEGFAICNGNNGTQNRNGKTAIAYGTTFSTINATGGSADSVVIEHEHAQSASTGAGGAIPGIVAANATGSALVYLETETVGVVGTDLNYQPYIVTLMIQRIA